MTTFTTTAFLTKLVANPAHRDVQRDLIDILRMHHTITTLACRPDFGPASRAARRPALPRRNHPVGFQSRSPALASALRGPFVLVDQAAEEPLTLDRWELGFTAG